MRCLILGGGGFIGSHLSDRLLSLGYKVRIFERPRVEPYRCFAEHEQLEWCAGDFQSAADVDSSVNACDYVFHLVSTTLPKNSNEDPIFDIESNVVSTLKLLSSSVRHGVKKIIFISSGGTVYGIPSKIPVPETHPTNPLVSYGISKLTIEKYLYLYNFLHGLDFTILRVSNPFGERQRVNTRQGVVAVFLNKALSDETIEIWGNGSVIRDYIFIDNVIDAFINAMSYTGKQNIFNIGSGTGQSLNEIIEIIEYILNRQIKKKFLPTRVFDIPANVLDITKAMDVLGWKPKISFKEGLLRTLDWMRATFEYHNKY